MATLKTGTASASINTDSKSYSATYIVNAPATASLLAIQTASGFVPFVTTWPDDPTARCKSVSPRHIEGRVWEVDVECDTSVDENDDENPLNEPMVRTWSSVEYDTYPYRDADGVVIANSAGQLFRDSVSVPVAYGVLSIQRNEAEFDYRTAIGYSNKLNQAGFYGAAAKKVLCKPISASEQHKNGISYASVTYTFYFADDDHDWAVDVLDHGSYYLNAAGERTLPEDSGGVSFSDTVMLDGIGGQLTQAEINAGNFRFRAFTRYRTADFGALNLE